jgi:polysaccharide export outer membrane protein
MWLRFVFLFVSAAALTFAQSEAPAPSAAAAKVSLPATASPTATTEARPAAENTPTAPKPAADAPVPAAPAAQTKPPAAKPAAKSAADSPSHKPYVYGALDVVVVKVYNQPNLSGAFPVSSDGLISIPVVGDLKAEGLTSRELRDELTERLKECCINNPEGEVDVQLGRNNSKRFFVYGAVLRGGEFPLDRDDMTVMDVLSSVGGFKDFAKKKKIRILRGTKTFFFNYMDVSKGKHMEQNIVIQNGDRIFVDE